MTILGEAQVRVGADTSTFDRDVTSGLKKTASHLSGLGGTISTGLKAGTVALAALGTAAAGAGAALFANTVRVGEMADELMDLSAITGVSTDTLQEWRYVAAKTGQGADFFSDSVKQMNRQMTAIENGTGRAATALDRLGVSVKNSDGTMKTSAQITEDAIMALSGIADESLRAQLATDIFARKANELIPVLDEGAEGLAAMRDEAYALGGVLSEDALRAADQFRSSLAMLKTQIGGVGNEVGAAMAGPFTSLVTFLSTSVMPKVGELSDKFTELWAAADQGKGFANTVGNFFREVFSAENIAAALTGIGDAIQAAVAGVAKWVKSGGLTTLLESFVSGKGELADAALDLFMGLVDALVEIVPILVRAAVEIVPKIVSAMIRALPVLVRGAVQLFLGLVKGLTEALPAITQAIVDAIPEIVDAIIEALPLIVDAAVQLFLGLVEATIVALPVIIDAVLDLIPAIIDALVSALPQLVEGAVRLFVGISMGVIQALPDIIATIATELIPGIVEGIVSGIGAILQAGRDLMNAFWDGLKQVAKGIWDWVVGLGNDIANALNPAKWGDPTVVSGQTRDYFNILDEEAARRASGMSVQEWAARSKASSTNSQLSAALAGVKTTKTGGTSSVLNANMVVNVTGAVSTTDARAAGIAAADGALRRLAIAGRAK